jgi:Xaa-Pro aminopeptidase
MLIREKVAQAVGLLREFDVDCWITFTRESGMNGDPTLAYLLASDVTWHTAIILTKSGKTYAIVGEYDRKSVEDLQAYGEVLSYVKSFREPFQTVMRAAAPSTIAVNFSKESEVCDGITHGMYLTLVDLLTELGLDRGIIQADRLVSALRQRKTPAEIASMRKAIQVTEEIFRSVAPYIRPGRTEREIAAFMKEEAKRHGVPFAWDPAVCPAVFTGPESAGAHYAPTDRPVEAGHVLNMDFGVKVDGYCSDLQRTFYVLAPGESGAPPEVQRGFDTVVEAIERAKRAIRPGVKGVEIDAVARNVITSAGYPEFPHGLGHQVGRFAHDGTALLGPAWEKYASKPFFPLETGMVFTLEPRLPVEGRGIATVEEMVVVTGDGAEWLSTPQKELLLVHHR